MIAALAVAVIVITALLVVLVITVLSRINNLAEDDPQTMSAEDWWRDSERIKAAVLAAQAEGVERMDLRKVMREDA